VFERSTKRKPTIRGAFVGDNSSCRARERVNDSHTERCADTIAEGNVILPQSAADERQIEAIHARDIRQFICGEAIKNVMLVFVSPS
jgi:hypothetical protein